MPKPASRAAAAKPQSAKAEPRRAPAGSLWLVTGGAGFLGQAVTRRLVGEGARVRILDTAPKPAELADARVEYIQGDIRDAATCAKAVEGAYAVVHAAAALPIHRSKRLIHAVNVDGTRNLLSAAAAQATPPRFVFISSTAVYGLHKHHPITEASPMVPVGPYGSSKVEAEQVCASFRDRLHVAVVRPKTFLGQGRLGVFEILFDWIHDGKRIPLIGNGRNRYQLLDVEDLVDAIVLCAQHSAGSDTFNVAAQQFGTLREDLTPLFEAAGRKPRFLPTPRRTAVSALFVLDKLRLSPLTRWHYGTMSSDSYVETDKARDLLGFVPRRSNRDTLLAAYTWYHAHRDVVRAAGSGTTHTVAWNQRALKLLKRLV